MSNAEQTDGREQSRQALNTLEAVRGHIERISQPFSDALAASVFHMVELLLQHRLETGDTPDAVPAMGFERVENIGGATRLSGDVEVGSVEELRARVASGELIFTSHNMCDTASAALMVGLAPLTDPLIELHLIRFDVDQSELRSDELDAPRHMILQAIDTRSGEALNIDPTYRQIDPNFAGQIAVMTGQEAAARYPLKTPGSDDMTAYWRDYIPPGPSAAPAFTAGERAAMQADFDLLANAVTNFS